MRIIRIKTLIFFFLFLLIGEMVEAKANKVLVISSYGSDYQWANSIIDGLNMQLAENYPGIELNVEFLSSELFISTDRWMAKMNAILESYEEELPLAIVLISDEAWMAYRAANHERFKETPLILSGVKPHSIMPQVFVNNLNTLRLSQFTSTEAELKAYNATAVLREMNVSGYLDLMCQLIPNLDNFVFVTDKRFYGVYCRLLFEEILKGEYQEYGAEYLDARFVKTDSLLRRLPFISEQSGLLLTSWLTGEHGFEYSKDYTYSKMASVLHTPIFLTNDIGVEKIYFLGGYFNKATFWGIKTGRILIEVLKGKSPRTIPIETYRDEQCQIDWTVLQKYNLSANNLPADTFFLNLPESIFKKYFIEMTLIGGLFLVVLIFYLLTLANNIKLKRARSLLMQSIQETEAANHQLKEVQQSLIVALSKAEESDRLKSAFLANMSHEIRTPLNAIVGFSNVIASIDTEEERREFAGIIENNNNLLLQLISDILDLSKIEAGVLDFSFDSLEVNGVCNDVVLSLQSKCKPSVQLLFKEHEDPLEIITDHNRLMQVLMNLINNSIKFTEVGTIEVGYCLANNDLVKFYVKDTGMGISQDKIDSIFERFTKLNLYVDGAGLGLSICKTIVKMLGGEIGVESEEGKGSCFWFTIRSQMS